MVAARLVRLVHDEADDRARRAHAALQIVDERLRREEEQTAHVPQPSALLLPKRARELGELGAREADDLADGAHLGGRTHVGGESSARCRTAPNPEV